MLNRIKTMSQREYLIFERTYRKLLGNRVPIRKFRSLEHRPDLKLAIINIRHPIKNTPYLIICLSTISISIRSKYQIFSNTTMNSNTPIFKLVVLGEGRVGKTSMSLKFVRGQFNTDQQSTVNASYLEKFQTLPNDKKVKLAIWDTAGQEKYNAIAPVYYRDAVGAIIVYQITSSQSFEKVKKWIQQLKSYAKKDIIIIVAGNKSDMENQRKVNHKEAQAYAREHGATHFLVSAKNGTNIQQLFADMAQKIYKTKQNSLLLKSNGRRGPKLRAQDVQQTEFKKNSRCCN